MYKCALPPKLKTKPPSTSQLSLELIYDSEKYFLTSVFYVLYGFFMEMHCFHNQDNKKLKLQPFKKKIKPNPFLKMMKPAKAPKSC